MQLCTEPLTVFGRPSKANEERPRGISNEETHKGKIKRENKSSERATR